MKRAAVRYREILEPIPEFESGDRFLINILSAAMLAAVHLELPEKPDVKRVEVFYHHAMTDNVSVPGSVCGQGVPNEVKNADD